MQALAARSFVRGLEIRLNTQNVSVFHIKISSFHCYENIFSSRNAAISKHQKPAADYVLYKL
jgi:hypothetical protein